MGQGCAACAARVRRRQNRPPQETSDVAAGAVRMVRGLGKRAAGDVDALGHLVALAAVVDDELGAAARRCVDEGGWSWGDVGRRLGITRQGARQRFGAPGGGQETAAG